MKMRDLTSVLGDVLGLLPVGEDNLRPALEHARDSANYCPPEHMYLWWELAHEAIADVIGDKPDLDTWHGPVLVIWSGKTLEDLRALGKEK